MRIETINPHGFCSGVDRAIRIANETLVECGRPVYCINEIVHNGFVVAEMTSAGMVFVDSIDAVPDGATAIASAHGVAPSVFEAALARSIRMVDATCPFVSAVHRKIRENFAKGIRTAVIGEKNHAEVRGYLGEPGACLPEDVKPGEEHDTVVQTTLDSAGHKGVCTATRDRQRAVREFVARNASAGAVGVVVVGGKNSSNTKRLAEVARAEGAASWLVENEEEARGIDFGGIEALGITSGASTPEAVLQAVISAISGKRADVVG